MAKLLEETPDVLEADATDVVLSESEERELRNRFSPPPIGGMRGNDADLSDGGYYGIAKITPIVGGRPSAEGRAAARKAWTWDGRETVMPLAWNPDGTVHDGGRRYLAKRVCLCCHTAGFRITPKLGNRCPQCVSTNCANCKASMDGSKVWHFDTGRVFKGWIVPCNYLKYEQVPFQSRPYGEIDCFLSMCTRRGARGFKTEEDMRLHGTMIHSAEYRVWMEAKAARKGDEIDSLRQTVNDLLVRLASQGIQGPSQVVQAAPVVTSVRPKRTDEEKQRRNEVLRKARAARKVATIQ